MTSKAREALETHRSTVSRLECSDAVTGHLRFMLEKAEEKIRIRSDLIRHKDRVIQSLQGMNEERDEALAEVRTLKEEAEASDTLTADSLDAASNFIEKQARRNTKERMDAQKEIKAMEVRLGNCRHYAGLAMGAHNYEQTNMSLNNIINETQRRQK